MTRSSAYAMHSFKLPVLRGLFIASFSCLQGSGLAADQDLVAAFGFDEGAGSTAIDASGNGHAGILLGPVWTGGFAGGALFFDGADDVVQVPHSDFLDLGAEWTLMAWVHPTISTSGWRAIIQKEPSAYSLHASHDGGDMMPAGGGMFAGDRSHTFTVSAEIIPQEHWSHLAVSYDGASIRIHIDGREVASKRKSGSLRSTDAPLRIGGNSFEAEFFHGKIDEVRIYRRALSAGEIADAMNTPLGAPAGPDDAPPRISVNVPADGSEARGILILTSEASDDRGVAGVQFLLDGEPLGAESRRAPHRIHWDTSGAANGTYLLSARARDAAGNAASADPIAVTVSNDRDPARIGAWEGPFDWPLVAIHMILLPTGDVLMWDDHTEAQGTYLWSVADGKFRWFSPATSNMFCAGHAALADGSILVAGGMGATYGFGIRDASFYDPFTASWTPAAAMEHPRYYPTACTLADGRVLVLSGTTVCSSCIAAIPEIYDPGTAAWTSLSGAASRIPYYPRVFQLPDGKVLVAGASEEEFPARLLDLQARDWTEIDAAIDVGGTSAMFLPGKVIAAGSSGAPLAKRPSTAATRILDATRPSPSWREVSPMAFPRSHHSMTLLPDGTALVTGGSGTSFKNDFESAALEPEIWSPESEGWTKMAPMRFPRLYHGSALLLPDGRVLVAGSGRPHGTTHDRLDGEIFSPPYLFRGDRPLLAAVPAVVVPERPFLLRTPDAREIGRITFIRLGSVTHGFDQGQRFLELEFNAASGDLLEAMAPPQMVAPPGYYMLFLLSRTGVPSIAAFVRLLSAGEDSGPPSAPGDLVASGSIEAIVLEWDPAIDDTGVAHYNIHRSTAAGFAPDASNRIERVFSTSYRDGGITGTHYYLVTAEDAAGNVGPPSGEASAVARELIREKPFVRGDANRDGGLDIADAVFILTRLFIEGREWLCPDAADSDDSGGIDITDAIYLLDFLFLGGPQPKEPYPAEGADPSEDSLDCRIP